MTHIKPSPLFLAITTNLLANLLVGCAGESSSAENDDPSAGESGSESGDPETTGASGSSTSTTSAGDDDSGDGSEGGADDSSGGAVDVVPPAIVAVTPADGDGGVRADAAFVIEFSESMNKASAQQAWQSADFPASAVTMAWNEAGDVLTVTPNDPIVLGVGTDPAMVEAPAYAFTITTVATDLAGLELETETVVTFTAARQITTSLVAIGKLTGSAGATGETALGFVAGGDTEEGQPMRGFASFEPTTLPDGILEFVAADLHLTVAAAGGTPYTDLGALVLYDVSFLDWVDAFDAPMEDLGTMCMADQFSCSEDVKEPLAADYLAGKDTSQFGVRFETESDYDGESDFVMFYAEGEDAPRLDIEYLIE